MALLDPSSDAYRVVAGLIESTHRRVGATRSQRWNGDIDVLSTVARQRSRSDLDGTIHLHPRNVLDPLTRADGGRDARWWYPRAARDAAYTVIYEALRQSSRSTTAAVDATGTLDSGLPPAARSLDQALAEQRAYEIAADVLTENGLAEVYVEDPPEAAAINGHGLARGMAGPFRVNPGSETRTAAARGFVERVADAADRGRDDVFDSLLTQAKQSRWSLAFKLVADKDHPGVLSGLAPEAAEAVYKDASRQAVLEWSRLSSLRPLTITSVGPAESWGADVGRAAADSVIRSAHTLGEARPDAAAVSAGRRELSPGDVLRAQAPLTTAKRLDPGPTASPAAPTQPQPDRGRHQPQR
ncbi:hypothetical protein [Kribbella sp. CA-247076]|uniref:hypothetical protein n=1 Tax=Kribbella sp. CA-247076 TaxID=3239941 RepID=UPI003D8C3EF1